MRIQDGSYRRVALPLLLLVAHLAWGAALTGVTLAADKASPQAKGATVTFTATAVGGAAVQYRYWQGLTVNGATTWKVAREFGADPVFAWTPAGAGSYIIEVIAREGTSATGLVSKAVAYTITGTAALSGVSLAATPASPQPTGAVITLTAAAIGGANVQYCYWLGLTVNGSTTWKLARDFAVSPVFAWTPAGAGSYIIEVIAREGTSATGLVSKAIAYAITGTAAFTGVRLSTDVSSPQSTYTPVTLTATPTGGSDLRYRFWQGRVTAAGTTWSMLRDYAAEATYRWTPPAAGDYLFEVNAREAAASAATALVASLTFTATGVTVTISPTTASVPAGSAATFTAAVTGAANTAVTWSVLAGGAGGSITPAGVYTAPTTVGADTVVATSVAEPRDSARATVTVTAPPSATLLGDVSLSLSPSSREVLAPIILTAKAYGGAAVQYQFVVGTLAGRAWTWTTLQPYGAAATCAWTPAAAGTYRVLAWARDGATTLKEFYDEQSVTIRNPGETPPARVSLARFQGNRAAAVSYTFDDGTKNQYVYGVPLFDQYGFHATFNVVGHYTPETAGNYDTVSWAEWRAALATGHEVGNHTLDHLDLTTLTEAQATTQIEENSRLIAEKLGAAPMSFALPHTAGSARIYAIIHRAHVALRGEYVNYGGDAFTATQANAMVDAAVADRRWLVPIMHGVADHTYLPISREALGAHLAYVKGCDAWVETFGTVSRYVLERDTTTIHVAEDAPGRCTFTLATALDTTLYTVPLTVRIGPLTAQPADVQAGRSGDAAPLPAQVTGGAGAWYIQLDAAPGPLPITVLWGSAS